MQNKNLLFWFSVVLNAVFLLGLITVLFTPVWDYMMFKKALPTLCPIIKEQRLTEFTGFIKAECEGK